MEVMLPKIQLANVVPGAVLVGKDDIGVNETFVGLIETSTDSFRAYIKILNSKQLINELLCSVIGRALDLKIPQGYLLRVSSDDLPDSNLLKSHTGEALAFGVRDIGHPSLKRRIANNGEVFLDILLKEWNEWDDAVIFDDWVANIDRNPGNLLVGSADDVWLIDHGHALTGPNWDKNDFKADKMYVNKLGDHAFIALTLPDRMKIIKKSLELTNIYKVVDINQAVENSMINAILSSEDLEAVISFVKDRIQFVEKIVSSRLGIPNIGL